LLLRIWLSPATAERPPTRLRSDDGNARLSRHEHGRFSGTGEQTYISRQSVDPPQERDLLARFSAKLEKTFISRTDLQIELNSARAFGIFDLATALAPEGGALVWRFATLAFLT
jgi:hypothetical protein